MPNTPEGFSILTWLWVLGLSILGGTVRTLTHLAVGMKFRDIFRRWIIDIIVSAFIGIITFLLCEYAGFENTLTAAMVGIASHMGTRAIVMIEEIFYRKVMGSK